MNAYARKTKTANHLDADTKYAQQHSSGPRFIDNRPSAMQMKKMQEFVNSSSRNPPSQLADYRTKSTVQEASVQKKSNNTGLPLQLKEGIESLSGYSLNDVKVHYNSAKPAQLQAHAYAQGSTIHVGPGQEKHLPHEAWHVVQQKQGRVKPTMQMHGGVNINDSKSLEDEATVMGTKALQSSLSKKS